MEAAYGNKCSNLSLHGWEEEGWLWAQQNCTLKVATSEAAAAIVLPWFFNFSDIGTDYISFSKRIVSRVLIKL